MVGSQRSEAAFDSNFCKELAGLSGWLRGKKHLHVSLVTPDLTGYGEAQLPKVILMYNKGHTTALKYTLHASIFFKGTTLSACYLGKQGGISTS